MVPGNGSRSGHEWAPGASRRSRAGHVGGGRGTGGARERLEHMPAPAVTTRPHVVVVGGGIAGLTAALEVLDRLPAAAVTVLEGSDRVGGKLRREPVAGHLVDVGAESMLALRPEAVDLVTRVGGSGDLVTPATTAASVWSRGALSPLPRATLMGV